MRPLRLLVPSKLEITRNKNLYIEVLSFSHLQLKVQFRSQVAHHPQLLEARAHARPTPPRDARQRLQHESKSSVCGPGRAAWQRQPEPAARRGLCAFAALSFATAALCQLQKGSSQGQMAGPSLFVVHEAGASSRQACYSPGCGRERLWRSRCRARARCTASGTA